MIIPKTFYIETYGCSSNKADSYKIAQILLNKGFKKIQNLYNAEYIIINSCGVKLQTQEKIIFRIKSLKLDKKQKMIISGCLPFISKELKNRIINSNTSIIGLLAPNSIYKISDLITTTNKPITEKSINKIPIIKINKKYDKNELIPWINPKESYGIVQISEGCNKNCTFCSTKISRGKLISFNPDLIKKQIKYYIDKGIKEIYLSSQDNGQYFFNNKDLNWLLRELIKEFNQYENQIFIRIGMLDPNYLINNLDNLINILESSKIFYKFLHIPIQSAADHVLKLMNRDYTKKDITYIFRKLKKQKITISTDIICGFPNESEKDFKETLEFINKFKPEIINISKYSVRPRTVAKNFKQLKSEIIKERSIKISELYRNYLEKIRQEWINWEGYGFITKASKKQFYFGRTQYYTPFIIKNVNNNIISKIKIVKYDKIIKYLIAELIS